MAILQMRRQVLRDNNISMSHIGRKLSNSKSKTYSHFVIFLHPLYGVNAEKLSAGLIKADFLPCEHGQGAGGEGVGKRLFYSERPWSKCHHFRHLNSVNFLTSLLHSERLILDKTLGHC